MLLRLGAGALAFLSLLLLADNASTIRFIDITAQAGLTVPNTFGGKEKKDFILESTGTGAAIFDYNGDGANDVFIANGTVFNPTGPPAHSQLYRNDGKGHFTDVARQAGLTRSGWAQAACVGDFDNDGHPDLFVTYYGPNSLYRNRGDGGFTDVTAAAGLPATGTRWGSGCAFIDYDGDGYLDIFVANYVDLDLNQTPKPGSSQNCEWKGMVVVCGPRGLPTAHNALYRNNRNGTFTDITAGSGLDVEMYGMGVAIGDYDNDGRDDVYITALEGDRLFHNEGNGKFRDVTKAAGIANSDFGTSAAWLDFDRDGKLDLFVANYVQWTPKLDLRCSLDGAAKSYCTPESYKGTRSRLFHNLGGGRFEDVAQKAGVGEATSKSLGVAVLDYNGDGWPDLFVSNDTQPNKLYRNKGNGTFTDEGMAAGVAYGEDGVARGAMGADAADYDRSGRPHLLVGNFSNQMLGLYHNEGGGLFVDEAPSSTVGRASLLSLTFGAFFFDFDLDGFPDILAANGHIEEEIGRVQPRISYREAPLLFRNLGAGKFENVSAKAGADFARPLVARGAAYADFDRDGDLDVLISTNHGPAYLYRNDGGNRNHWINIRLSGTRSNRDGIGAVVRVQSASGKQWAMVRSGSSYCSASDLALTFGLGKDVNATVEIEWPSGKKQPLGSLAADRFVLVDEDRGVTSK
jgi:uncharacterized protein YndB with AHSA1/START domain